MAVVDYEAMYDDLLAHLREASNLVKEVKINKQNCFRLDGKFASLIVTIQSLKADDEPISTAIYHKFVSILIDIQSFLKKSSVKTFLGSLNKNNMRTKFDQLSQKLNEIMMEEPRFLPRENKTVTNTQSESIKGHKKRSPLMSPSSLSFEDANLPKPAQEELIYRWILENTSLSRDQAERYAVQLVRRSIHSEARLGRKISREPDFLKVVGIPPQDAILIVDALKSAGYLTSPSPEKSPKSTTNNDSKNRRSSFVKSTHMSPSNSLKHMNASDILNIPELTPLTVETTLQAMIQSQQTNNESLAYTALIGVSELVEGSEEYQLNYGIEGGCSTVLSLLASMVHIENICEIALKTICLLCRYGKSRSTTSSENIAQFGLNNGCHLIVSVANSFPENDIIQFWACKAIVSLSSNMENNLKLGEAGACELICDLMQRRKDSLVFPIEKESSSQTAHARPVPSEDETECQMSLHIWGSLINLALCTENNERFSEINICYTMLMNWSEQVSNRAITLWGCMATQNLALNEKNKYEIAHSTGCELIAQALRIFPNDEEIATQAFMAIQNVANHNNENNTLLGEVGICEEIVNVMRIHLSDEYITQRGCMAIMNLSYNHLSNKLKLILSNISEILNLALTLHSGNATVFEFAFGAIVNLTDTEDSSEETPSNTSTTTVPPTESTINIITHFATSTLTELILDNLQLFHDDNSDTVIELGLWTIKNISLYHPELFDHISACSVICKCMSTKLGSPSIIEMGCWIVKILSQKSSTISFKFGTVGICDQIISALQLHCNNEMIIEIGCATIQSLCELCDANRRILVNLDAYSLITKLIKQHYSNEIIETIGFAALASLSKMEDDGSSCESIRRTRSLSIGSLNPNSQKQTEENKECTSYLNYLSDDDEMADDKEEGGEGEEKEGCKISSITSLQDSTRSPNTAATTTTSSTAAAAANRKENESANEENHLIPTSHPHKTTGRTRDHSSSLDDLPTIPTPCSVDECLLILQQLKSHFEKSKMKSSRLEEYSSTALSTISSIIHETNGGIKQKEFGEKGVCELIVQIISPILASRLVCLSGLEAICSLCRYGNDKSTSNPQNVSLLGIHGACKVVIDLGNTHCCREVEENGNITIQFDFLVSLWVTRAITYMASNEANNSHYYQHGVSNIIYTILSHCFIKCSEYFTSSLSISSSNSSQSSENFNSSEVLDVIKQCWSAVINLALNSENGKSMCDIGVCDYLVSYLTLWKHFSIDLLLVLILSLQNLSLTEKTREKLGRVGVCTHVVRLLEIQLRKENPPEKVDLLAQYTCMAIHKLSMNNKNSQRFGDSRGCELILNVIKKYSGNMTIEQIGCMAMINLSSNSIKNVNCFLNNNIFNYLSKILSSYHNKKGSYQLIEYSLKLLKNIVQFGYQDPNNQMYTAITRASLIELLLATLTSTRKMYKSHETEIYNNLTLHGLNVITTLLPIEGCKQRLIEVDLKTILGKIAKDFRNNVEMFKICSTIWVEIHPTGLTTTLSTDSDSVQSPHLSADSSNSHHTGGDQQSQQSQQQRSQINENKSHEEEKELNISVPEVIAKLKRSLSLKDDLGTANSLRIISKLADGNQELQILLGRQGACREVTDALKLFRNSMLVCENGLRAVSYLSRYGQDKSTANSEHIEIFGELGLCPVIVEILRKFSGNERIALYGCKTIMNLGSLAENNACFGQYGACEVILIILQTFSHLEVVLKHALWAVINLSSYDENNKRFSGIGCNIIVDLLKSNLSEPESASWLLLAVQNLSNHKENRKKLGELGVCEYVIHAMTIHMKHNPAIEFGCMALDKLGVDSKNTQLIGKSHGCELLLNILKKHLENLLICELAWRACHRIARDQEENIVIFGMNNIGNLMCQTIQKHAEVEEIMEQVLLTVTVIMTVKVVISPPTIDPITKKKHRRTTTREVFINEMPMKRLLGDAGLCKPLVNLLGFYTSDAAITKATQGHSNNIGMIYLCLKIISMLSINDLVNKIQFGEYGCCEKTIAAMTLHLGSEDIAVKGCTAIASLVNNCSMNSLKFSAIGANAVIFRVLQKYTLTKKVIMSGFEALISLIEGSTESSHGLSSCAGKRHHSSRSTDESGFDIVSKIIRLNAQNKSIAIGGIQLIYLLLLSFISHGSGTNVTDYLPGSGEGKVVLISSKSIQIIGEVVHKGLTHFPKTLPIVYYCLLIISDLSIEVTNSAYLGGIGICQIVVQTIESLLFKLSTDPLEIFLTSPQQQHHQQHQHENSFQRVKFIQQELSEIDDGDEDDPTKPENAFDEMLIFEVGLRAISSLAVDESNSQILSDCNVGDIVLKISSIYFTNESVMKQATLSFAYLTKLYFTRNMLINNNLISLLLKILSTYSQGTGTGTGTNTITNSTSIDITEHVCTTLINIFQSRHVEGCKVLIERGIHNSLLDILDHFKKNHKLVKDILLIYFKLFEIVFPSQSNLNQLILDYFSRSSSSSSSSASSSPSSLLNFNLSSFCEKIFFILKLHSESKDICDLACSVMALVCFHYPVCSSYFYQHGYGELSIYLLHSHIEHITTVIHIIRSYNIINLNCKEFVITFVENQFLDFLYHDILSNSLSNEILIHETLHFTQQLISYLTILERLEMLVASKSDEEMFLDYIYRIISLYPSHNEILALCTAILSLIYSSLSNENNEFINSNPLILTILDSSTLLTLVLTTFALSRRNIPHQNNWILLLKSVVVYCTQREMKQLTEQVQDNTSQIIERVTRLLSKQRTSVTQSQICEHGCFILGYLGSFNHENNLILLKFGHMKYCMDVLISLFNESQQSDSNGSGNGNGNGSVKESVVAIFDSLMYSLSIFSSHEESRLVLKDLSLCEYIGSVLIKFITSEELVNNCCQIIVNLALIDDNCKVLLGKYSACDGCYLALSSFYQQSNLITKNACYACMTLVIVDDNKEIFSHTSMCQFIILALNYYKEDEDFIELGLGALINLADHHEGNKNSICLGNIHQTIIGILTIHTTDMRLFELCLMLLVNMTEDSHMLSRELFSSITFFQFIFQLLRNASTTYTSSTTTNTSMTTSNNTSSSSSSITSPLTAIYEQGLWYLKNTFNNPKLKKDLVSFLTTNMASICEFIIQILTKNTDFNSVVVEQACHCLKSLLVISSISFDTLIRFNTFSSLLACCYVYSKEELILDPAIIILSKLLSYCSNYSTDDIENTLERLCTIHQIITNVLIANYENTSIALNCLQIISEIYQRKDNAKMIIKDWSDTCEAIVYSLQSHYSIPQIVIICTELIVCLSNSSREYQSVIGATGGGEAFIITISHYLDDNLPLVVLCLRACNSLLINNAANVVMIGPNLRQLILQIFPVIIENCLLNNYHPEVQYSDLIANSFICLKLLAGSNKQFFIDSGVLEHLSELLAWNSIHQQEPDEGDGDEDTRQLQLQQAGSFSSSISLFKSSSSRVFFNTDGNGGGDEEEQYDDDPSLPAYIAGCNAFLVLLGDDCIDTSLFGGIDLPSCLLKRVLVYEEQIGQQTHPNPKQREELLETAMKLILTILRLDHNTTNPKDKRNHVELPLLPDLFRLLTYHHTALTVINVFLYVVKLEGLNSLLVVFNNDKRELFGNLQSISEEVQQEYNYQQQDESIQSTHSHPSQQTQTQQTQQTQQQQTQSYDANNDLQYAHEIISQFQLFVTENLATIE